MMRTSVLADVTAAMVWFLRPKSFLSQFYALSTLFSSARSQADEIWRIAFLMVALVNVDEQFPDDARLQFPFEHRFDRPR